MHLLPYYLIDVLFVILIPRMSYTLMGSISKIGPEQRGHIKDRAGEGVREKLSALVPARMYRRENGSKGPTNHKGRGNEVN